MQLLKQSSRWKFTPTLVSANGQERFTTHIQPILDVSGETLYMVVESDVRRPDLIAHKTLGSPDLWWVIAQHNKVRDVYALKAGDRLLIPRYTIREPLVREDSKGDGICQPVPDNRLGHPAPYSSLDLSSDEDNTISLLDSVGTVGFPMPPCITGSVHFEAQIASDGEFLTIAATFFTAVNQDRWYYYNSSSESHQTYPQSGLNGNTNSSASIYFQLSASDPVAPGGTYYVRYRAVVQNNGIVQKGKWISPPPITLGAF